MRDEDLSGYDLGEEVWRLDVVPMRWGSPAEVADFQKVRARLLKSLRETTESHPDTQSTMRPLLTFLPQAD